MNYSHSFQNVLYSLKRDYGQPVNLVWRLTSETDVETGTVTKELDSLQICNAIVLPMRTQRDFEYDLTWIATSKNFVYGGLFDKQQSRVIIDKDDLPSDFEIKIGYYVIVQGKRYEIKVANTYDAEGIFDCLAEQLTDTDLENNIKEVRYQEVHLTQTVEVTIA